MIRNAPFDIRCCSASALCVALAVLFLPLLGCRERQRLGQGERERQGDAHLVAAQQQQAEAKAHQGLRYWLEVKDKPRPLRFHHVRVDLRNPYLEITAQIAPDPDGDGPAMARLLMPSMLAKTPGLLVLVNANAFAKIPQQKHRAWYPGMPVIIHGLAAANGVVRSPDRKRFHAFWIDAQGLPHIGSTKTGTPVRTGVAGFSAVLRDGKPVQKPGGPVHPRTAVGFDAAKRWLYLVVVDGRQKGYSEGVTLHELALHMKRIGCASALNLDGGGSSTMMFTPAHKPVRVMNCPSTKVLGVSVTRPIPVALIVRVRQPKAW